MESKFTAGACGPATPTARRGTNIGRAVSTFLASWLIATAASAGAISGAASRALLAGNDVVEWGSAADDGTTVASPYNRVSTGGVGVTATLPGGFAVFVQNGGGGYTANFAANDVLLSTFFADGPVSITFDEAIRGLGFNVVNDNFGDFTGTLDFYGAGDVLFGSVTVNGTSNAANDGSAPFLGGFSTLRDIFRVDVSVSTTLGGSPLSLNQMSLLTTNPPGQPIPEPASIALASLALAMAVASRRRRPGVFASSVKP